MSQLAILPNGNARQSCILEQPNNVIFFKKDVNFANVAAILNYENWRAMIQDNLEAYPTREFYNVTATKPAAQKETQGSNAETTTRFSPGGAMFMLKTNYADFKEILTAFNGGEYQVAIGLGSNMVMVWENRDGEQMGFTAQVNAVPAGTTGKDAKIEDFAVEVNYQDVEEFKCFRIHELPFDLRDLEALSPGGMQLDIVSGLSATTVVVDVFDRFTRDAVSDTLTVNVIRSVTDQALTTSITNTAGRHTITIEKGSNVELADGEFVELRLEDKTGDVFNRISNTIRIIKT